MQSYNIAEAKAHLSEILEQVAHGEEILLTRRGRPIARIIPTAGDPASILGAGIQDPNINLEAITQNEWWKPMSEDEAQPWYE